jgi:hypothetical protein
MAGAARDSAASQTRRTIASLISRSAFIRRQVSGRKSRLAPDFRSQSSFPAQAEIALAVGNPTDKTTCGASQPIGNALAGSRSVSEIRHSLPFLAQAENRRVPRISGGPVRFRRRPKIALSPGFPRDKLSSGASQPIGNALAGSHLSPGFPGDKPVSGAAPKMPDPLGFPDRSAVSGAAATSH